jgi:hypothetical protein
LSSRLRALGSVLVPWLLLAPRAGRPEEPPVFDLPEQVVRLPRAAGDETGAATVVEAERFAGESKDVAALVATAPGVAVQEYGGLGQLATVSIRGAAADGVKVLVDGLPLGSAAGGGVDLSTIPRAWVDRIEVLRGAEGARFGQGALGGVLNVVTRRIEPGSWSARLAAGSFETGSAGADVAAGGERWGALLAAGADGTSGRFPYLFDDRPSLPGSPLEPRLRAHGASASGGLLAKGFARLAPGRLDLLAQLSAGDRQLPGSPWLQRSDNDDRMRESRAAASARAAFPVGPGVLVALEAQGRAERLDLRLAPLAPVGQRELAGAARVATTWVAGPSLLEAGFSAGGDRLAAGGLGGTRSRAELAAWLAEELLVAGGRARLAPALRAERRPVRRVSGKLGAAARSLGRSRLAPALAAPSARRASASSTWNRARSSRTPPSGPRSASPPTRRSSPRARRASPASAPSPPSTTTSSSTSRRASAGSALSTPPAPASAASRWSSRARRSGRWGSASRGATPTSRRSRSAARPTSWGASCPIGPGTGPTPASRSPRAPSSSTPSCTRWRASGSTTGISRRSRRRARSTPAGRSACGAGRRRGFTSM